MYLSGFEYWLTDLTQHSFPRRFRIYQISDFGETVNTYKRTEDDEVIDREILVGEGSPMGLGRDPSPEMDDEM